MKPEEKKCGQSCGCEKMQEQNQEQKNLERKSEEAQEAQKDPTRFGDWEVNGRAIDF